jgi:hypothetical protein
VREGDSEDDEDEGGGRRPAIDREALSQAMRARMRALHENPAIVAAAALAKSSQQQQQPQQQVLVRLSIRE